MSNVVILILVGAAMFAVLGGVTLLTVSTEPLAGRQKRRSGRPTSKYRSRRSGGVSRQSTAKHLPLPAP